MKRSFMAMLVATFSSADDKLKPTEHVEKSLALVQQLAARH